MKNIHILPTEKPSRLFKFANELHLDTTPKDYYKKYNIYITSDEKIKDKDYVLSDASIGALYLDGVINTASMLAENQWKKVILSTDSKLIADGVQAIDDEFLEWFVKNPSCESVEWDRNYNRGNGKFYYKIIIPQEDKIDLAKLRTTQFSLEMATNAIQEVKQEGYICPHTKMQCDDECCVSAEDCHIISSLASGMVDCDKSKQETLREAADNWVEKPVIGTRRESFIAGAKWQAERMYSEDEVRNIANWAFDFYKTDEFSDSELEDEFNRILSERFKKK